MLLFFPFFFYHLYFYPKSLPFCGPVFCISNEEISVACSYSLSFLKLVILVQSSSRIEMFGKSSLILYFLSGYMRFWFFFCFKPRWVTDFIDGKRLIKFYFICCYQRVRTFISTVQKIAEFEKVNTKAYFTNCKYEFYI